MTARTERLQSVDIPVYEVIDESKEDYDIGKNNDEPAMYAAYDCSVFIICR